MTGTKKGREKSPPVSGAAYIAALVEAHKAAKAAGLAVEPGIVDRLQRDQTGEALAAVNQLRRTHDAATVLRHTLTTYIFGQNARAMREHLAKEAAEATQKAEEVRRLMRGAAHDYSASLTFSLGCLYEYWLQHARGCEVGIPMLGLPRKIATQNAPLAISLRMLRDALFPKARAPHEPLRLLMSVAAGETINADLVRDALRESNGLAAKAKAAGLMVPDSENSARKR